MKILKDKRLINTIKWTVAILSFFYLVYSINKKIDQIDISFFKLKAISEQLIRFVLLLFLMGLNWFIESIKWKFALKNIQKISLKTAISSVLAGISTGIFTPNRVGEFVGKIFFLEEDNREKAISVNIIASYSQLLVTILLGTFALLVASSSVLILVVVFLVVMYINITRIINWSINKLNISFLGKVEFTNKTDLGILFLFSLFRYLVFLVQFIVSLKLVGININLFVSIKSIATYYLYLAAIPTYAWSELGVRGAIAVKVFDTLSHNPLQTLTASSILWIINIAVPALLGLFFLLKEKRS
jgi:hypothetical protein